LGKRLQEDVVILGTMAGTINRAVKNDYGHPILFRDLVDDLLVIAASLGTEGSMIRVNSRVQTAGKLLSMNMKKSVFNNLIKDEIKDAEGNFPRKRFNFFNNNMQRRLHTSNSNNNAYNAFRSGYNANDN
jgi:hypothetical protein